MGQIETNFKMTDLGLKNVIWEIYGPENLHKLPTITGFVRGREQRAVLDLHLPQPNPMVPRPRNLWGVPFCTPQSPGPCLSSQWGDPLVSKAVHIFLGLFQLAGKFFIPVIAGCGHVWQCQIRLIHILNDHKQMSVPESYCSGSWAWPLWYSNSMQKMHFTAQWITYLKWSCAPRHRQNSFYTRNIPHTVVNACISTN